MVSMSGWPSVFLRWSVLKFFGGGRVCVVLEVFEGSWSIILEELPLEFLLEPAILLFLIFRVHESSLSSYGCWEQVK
ncbi:hypothetical protein COLO4_07448 [Corchorus olitorius]|uniref:Uncharacterized protein n=1 Tax=Corchorus olitorius TaxID=93759 RepID=A0A1R3KJT8_9ROSI|nr:hypothetical protein COLO4_07448 [Corchorus olitorius]